MRGELMSNQAEAGADSGPGPSDGSANSEGLSQANPPLHPTQLEKQDKDAMAQTGIVGIDDSTRTVQIVAGSRIFGTTDPHAINVLLEQVLAVTPKNGEYSLENLKWSVATAQGIGPRNALEGLLVAQMIGVHNLAMACLRRASIKEQTQERIDANVHRAVRLLRTFTSQMEALNRNRGKISQQMVVGNVNVNEGGQAIVGAVRHDGTGKASPEDDTDKVQ
jgi:hypothetical protein